MLPRRHARGSLRLARDLRIVFAVTILLPGLVLAFVGVRSWLSERAQADQQIRERLDRSVALVAQDLEDELQEWQLALSQIGQRPTADPATFPLRIRRALETNGAGALVLIGEPPRVVPARQVLYQLASPDASPGGDAALPSALAAAELIEVRDKDFPRAIAAYRHLLSTRPSSERPLTLHRLARTHRKAGDLARALRTYEELRSIAGARLGSLPADLVARYEVCAIHAAQGARASLAGGALDLYRELVHGRWSLDKPRYVFYAERARLWLEGDDAVATERRPLIELEGRKRALTEAIEAMLVRPDPSAKAGDDRRQLLRTDAGTHLVLWDAALVDATPRLALVLAASFLDANVWPHAFAIARGEGLEGALVAPDGHEVFRSTQGERAAARQDTLMAAGTLQDAEVLWRLEVWPRDPATLYADVNRRQWSYLAMLVMVVALLLFGTYLTARTVRKELEFARLKGDFVSTVSHEFRSPLTGIRQLGELLMRGRVPTDERRQQYYELITRESDRLTRLVDNLLDFGRLEEGRRQFQFEPFDPRPWLRTLVADFGLELPPGHGPVVAEIPDTLPLIVADREALSSAVYNLLDNAVKYSPADSPIRVAAEGRNGHLVIRVCDQGVGIADADRTHVFEKFHRGSGEIARRVKGAGLGLSLVHHIVTAHGGQVDFDSRPDQGTTFSIELKAAPPTPYASHPRR